MSNYPPPYQPQYQPAPQTSTTAIISLIAGILGFVALPVIGSIVAIITGHMAKGEIARSGGVIGGAGLATAGLVMGYIGVGLTVVGVCFFGVAVALPLCISVLAALGAIGSSNTHSMLLPWLLAA